MNTFMKEMVNDTNFKRTENGAMTHKSTLNPVLDMFAMGGAYRTRSDEDCILLFSNALEANETLALRCLFYLRDIRGGQGERRFFRVCYRWLANQKPEVAKRNFQLIAEYGRYDDILYTLIGTPLEKEALQFIKKQLVLDMQCKTPSLLAKWLPSINASSAETKRLGHIVRSYLGMTQKQYRKTLSELRKRINVLERLMSAGRWDEIEFDKIPSKAGLKYKNAFAKRDIIAKKYEAFAKDKDTKVNASALYPHDVAHKAFHTRDIYGGTDREMIQKYWDNLPNFYGDREENGLAIVDVSGSMSGTPMEVAVSLGAYIAEKAHGPFANHFITFSSNPELVKFEGVDITDKFRRCIKADWGMNTNLEAVFNMLLNIAKKDNVKQEDMPERLYILSDMEFDRCIVTNDGRGEWYYNKCYSTVEVDTLLEKIAKEWAAAGYELPSVVFWNLNARHCNIPALGKGFSYVSGFSPVMINNILSGKDGIDLMLDKLNSDRYMCIK